MLERRVRKPSPHLLHWWESFSLCILSMGGVMQPWSNVVFFFVRFSSIHRVSYVQTIWLQGFSASVLNCAWRSPIGLWEITWVYLTLNKYLFNTVNNKERGRGQRSVVWLKRGQPYLHHLHVLSTVFSWRTLSSFSLWIILLPSSLPPFVRPLLISVTGAWFHRRGGSWLEAEGLPAMGA